MDILNEYNKNVFSDEYLRENISKKDYEKYKSIVKNKIPLDKEIANTIAEVIGKWAIENGATHYSHWFQPLTGTIAEKQTSFISVDGKGKPIIDFTASALITGEIDASSFPNGGLRSIFEARGLISWDYTYPVFIKENSGEKVLCIPTILKSLDGTSLDKRSPLLNSCEALNKQVLRVLRLFGDTEIHDTISAVGVEQEYFLIKRKLFEKRKDLELTGRTLFGKELLGITKHHYMGAINVRTGKFMISAEQEMWKLGIPVQVKHNEVAPRQYEIVPHFEDLKFAANHDFLIMEILEREAKKHDFVCLLDEKPFRGINGSGKHNNWSINTPDGKKIFSYGKTAEENARFLTMIIALISALDKHSDLIRATVASNNNDNRLSGYEAPSSIVSVYLGKELTDVFEELVNDNENKIRLGKDLLHLAKISITDRNRTSPFAFLGNRFEFRMPGASASITVCNTVLNVIMTEALAEIADQLEDSNDFFNDLKKVIVNLYKQHSRIIYNGNSYSEEWEEEAKLRGLKNIKKAPEAYKAFITDKSINLFEQYNIYTEEEMKARYIIKMEKYIQNVMMEAKIMLKIARQDITPQVVKYALFLQEGVAKLPNVTSLKDKENYISNALNLLNEKTEKLQYLIDKEADTKSLEEKAEYCSDVLKAEMEELRQIVDELEGVLPAEYWPMPTYSELLN